MDKPRWLVSYSIGLLAGQLLRIYSNGVWHWVIAFGAPFLAMLIEQFRSLHQNEEGS